MTKKTVLELTDARFLTEANGDVMNFVQRGNSSAHSDVGSVLIALGKACPGAHFYSPSFASCMFVVLHTVDNLIFGIAFGQRGLAFRFSTGWLAAACDDGGIPAPAIGPNWIAFPPFDASGQWGTHERLQRWCARAFADGSFGGARL